jgi:hypothetical protein
MSSCARGSSAAAAGVSEGARLTTPPPPVPDLRAKLASLAGLCDGLSGEALPACNQPLALAAAALLPDV